MSSGKNSARITYNTGETGTKKKINRIKNGVMPKNSAIPAHTPDKTLSDDDFVNLFIKIPPWIFNPSICPFQLVCYDPMSFENPYDQHSSIEQIKSHYCYYMLIHV